MGKKVLELKNVSKSFGKRKIIDNLNLEVEEGEIYGFLGPNGAGKSTLMKIIFAIEKQTSGKIYYKGEEINYQDFQELKLAIESLGGEYEKERDFSNDKVYRKIMEQKKGMKS